MREETRKRLRRRLTVRQAKEYTKHGCNIEGDLLIVDTSEYWELYSVDDCLEVAENLIDEAMPYPQYIVLRKLAMPDVVCKIISEPGLVRGIKNLVDKKLKEKYNDVRSQENMTKAKRLVLREMFQR